MSHDWNLILCGFFCLALLLFKMEQLTTVCPHSSRFPALLVKGLGVPLGADILS